MTWTPWMRRLVRAHPVVSIDLRGHGSSRDAWHDPDARLTDYAADVLSVLDHLRIPACHFVGESFGGTIGLHLAAGYPDRLPKG